MVNSASCLAGGEGANTFQALLAQYVKRVHNPNASLAAPADYSQAFASVADTIASADERHLALIAALKGSSNLGQEDILVEKQIQNIAEVKSTGLLLEDLSRDRLNQSNLYLLSFSCELLRSKTLFDLTMLSGSSLPYITKQSSVLKAPLNAGNSDTSKVSGQATVHTGPSS